MTTKMISLRIPSDLVEQIDQVSSATGLNQSAIIKLALKDFLAAFNRVLSHTDATAIMQLLTHIMEVSDNGKK